MVDILGIVLQFLERHTIEQGSVSFEWEVKYLHKLKVWTRRKFVKNIIQNKYHALFIKSVV